jgi:hypothetical protein
VTRRPLSILIRRTPAHACVAWVEPHPATGKHALRLLRVTSHTGASPEVADLIGRSYYSRRALRAAILNRMQEAP